jgi:uncharacterized membrane protein YfcA
MQLPLLLSDPHFYLAGITAVLMLGIAKSGFPGSFGAMGVPLMSLAMSPVQAAAIVLPLLCVIDWWGVKVYWGAWDRQTLKTILPGALVGIGAGSLLFGTVSDATILVLVGSIAVLFTVNSWLRLAARQGAATQSGVKGGFWSAVSGFTSFVAHAGGPPMMVYLLPLKLPQSHFIATMGVCFLIMNAIKLVPYAYLGQFSTANLLSSLVLVPVVPVGIHLGRWLQSRVSHKVFYRISEISLFLNGLLLIYEGGFAH